jgi:hypothetical protein
MFFAVAMAKQISVYFCKFFFRFISEVSFGKVDFQYRTKEREKEEKIRRMHKRKA